MMLIRAAAVLLVVLVATAEAGSVGAGPSGPPCRHYCIRETPNREKYCCDRGDLPDVPSQIHPGRCPYAIQCPVSPGVVRFSPKRCAQDAHCRYHEKCCYDSCLEYHTCKVRSKN